MRHATWAVMRATSPINARCATCEAKSLLLLLLPPMLLLLLLRVRSGVAGASASAGAGAGATLAFALLLAHALAHALAPVRPALASSMSGTPKPNVKSGRAEK